MPKNDKRKTDEDPQQEVIDREVLDVIQEEKRKASARGPRDPAAERKKKRLASDALRLIKARDARAFTELLRQAGIREGSPEWKNAWKAFYST